jgi:hypothetical protein
MFSSDSGNGSEHEDGDGSLYMSMMIVVNVEAATYQCDGDIYENMALGLMPPTNWSPAGRHRAVDGKPRSTCQRLPSLMKAAGDRVHTFMPASISRNVGTAAVPLPAVLRQVTQRSALTNTDPGNFFSVTGAHALTLTNCVTFTGL